MTAERDLPQSNAAFEGATGGSLGGASMTDLKRGYSLPAAGEHAEGCCCNECMTEYLDGASDGPAPRGFLTRPEGWER